MKSEIINYPPFYSIEKVQNKKLLMVGGGYIPGSTFSFLLFLTSKLCSAYPIVEFLSHAKLLGVEIYLIDDPKMEQRNLGRVKKFIGSKSSLPLF